jgi:biotin carboxylase
MKTSRIAALALIATAATGFNAYAQSADAGIDPAQNFVSTANAAQVRADAVQANAERVQRGYSQESGEFLSGTPAFKSDVARDTVRAEAIKASRTVRVTEAG